MKPILSLHFFLPINVSIFSTIHRILDFSNHNIINIKKENIKINAYENSVEIISDDPQRKYHKVIDLPPEADIETVKSIYNNGILEIVFNKKKQTKSKGKEIKVE